ncbi:MAG: ABC transporter permease [Thermoleophilaceae bacterium]
MSIRRPVAARRPMLRFLGRRIAASVVLLFVASVLIFAGTQLLPGDAATAVLGRNATPEALADVRAELELDRPVIERYSSWLGGFVSGDLGRSLASRQPVSDLAGDRFVNSAVLAFLTAVVLFPLAIGLGVLAAVRRGRAVDHAISGLSLTFIAAPEFVLGTFLALIFAVNLKLVPPVSLLPPGSSPLSEPSLLVLPVATLVLVGAAYMIRMVRAGMIEALASDYVQMARLRGVSERRVVLSHALRNALAPTVQVAALTLQWLIGGIVIVETVFAYPGIGQGLVQGVVARDIPYVASISMVLAIVYVAIATIADLLVVLLIPRLRTAA